MKLEKTIDRFDGTSLWYILEGMSSVNYHANLIGSSHLISKKEMGSLFCKGVLSFINKQYAFCRVKFAHSNSSLFCSFICLEQGGPTCNYTVYIRWIFWIYVDIYILNPLNDKVKEIAQWQLPSKLSLTSRDQIPGLVFYFLVFYFQFFFVFVTVPILIFFFFK